MSNQIEEQAELDDLHEYLRAGYLGALRSDGGSISDAPAIAFSDHVMARVQALLAQHDRKQKENWKKDIWAKGYNAGGSSMAELLINHQMTLHRGKRGQYSPVQAVPVSAIERLAHLSSNKPNQNKESE